MPVSKRIFRLLLFGYPREFRREFGPDMMQLFNDCYGVAKRNNGALSVPRLWIQVSLDSLKAAPREHWDNFRKDNGFMNKLGKNIVALLICLGVVVAAFFLLSYGRKHEVSTILMFGRVLDALVTTGIVANIIIFLVMIATHFNPLRIALWTLLIVHAALLLLAVLVGGRVDPAFSLGGVLIGYAVSFLFWLAVHWIWSRKKTLIPTTN